MTRHRIGRLLGSSAAFGSFLSATLSVAPFTPAIMINLVTVPLALAAIALGAWRTGVVAIYWTIGSVLVFPEIPWSRPDAVLACVYTLGLILSVLAYAGFRRSGVEPGDRFNRRKDAV